MCSLHALKKVRVCFNHRHVGIRSVNLQMSSRARKLATSHTSNSSNHLVCISLVRSWKV